MLFCTVVRVPVGPERTSSPIPLPHRRKCQIRVMPYCHDPARRYSRDVPFRLCIERTKSVRNAFVNTKTPLVCGVPRLLVAGLSKTCGHLARDSQGPWASLSGEPSTHPSAVAYQVGHPSSLSTTANLRQAQQDELERSRLELEQVVKEKDSVISAKDREISQVY